MVNVVKEIGVWIEDRKIGVIGIYIFYVLKISLSLKFFGYFL